MKAVRVLLYLPVAFLRLVLVFLVTGITVFAGVVWLSVTGESRNLQKHTMKAWGKCILAICGIKVIKNDVPASSQFVLMSNHRSYLDIFILAAYIPAAFLAKSEVQRWPMLKAAARFSGIIFVSRIELRSLVSAMSKIKEKLGRGIPVALFPEGTTFRGPLTKPFKKGSFKIAADLNIPVIPAAIHYEDENDAWVDDDTFVGHFLTQMGKPVTRVHLLFGKPVSGADYENLQKRVHQEIDSLLMKNMKQA